MRVEDLPAGDAAIALSYPHFPTCHQAVIWRNWNLVPLKQLADTLKATPDQIEAAAAALGLVRNDADLGKWAERGFLTIIRRNWDLLPYEQLLTLLDWTPDKLAFVLKEDDFMWVKMGNMKPICEEVLYRELTSEEEAATATLRESMALHFDQFPDAVDYPFGFLMRYGQAPAAVSVKTDDFGLKMIYSYSAIYGDPLLDDKVDPYPDGLLADYAAAGINAVWLQGTLYTLVPWLGDNDLFSKHWQTRLENLRKLTERAAKYGIAVYLYMNEPRNMPGKFFLDHPTWRGPKNPSTDDYAMCTSQKAVLDALENGMEMLFREVPKLGGVFTITMSENLTHCLSRHTEGTCPACEARGHAEIVAEVNTVILRGARKAKPDARVLAWTWAWSPPWDVEAVKLLPDDITVMAVSETLVPTESFGVRGEVIDYSISKVGPGPIAKRIWKAARERGLKITAKVQFNCTWELSAVPYIPVPGLVKLHMENLKKAGVTDLMLSWTLGGYPGGNLELLDSSTEALAQEKFGSAAAPLILDAWQFFAKAFEYFPLHQTSQLYLAPQNYGPMSLLWEKPTHRSASMIGFPYDDLKGWTGYCHYPEEVFEEAFKCLSEDWAEGMRILRKAGELVSGRNKFNYQELFNVAEAAYCHFRSTYLQICFVRRRDVCESAPKVAILEEEIALAKRLYEVIRRDSRIGFEASNHYYYVENDLKEKVLNCEYLINKFKAV